MFKAANDLSARPKDHEPQRAFSGARNGDSDPKNKYWGQFQLLLTKGESQEIELGNDLQFGLAA